MPSGAGSVPSDASTCSRAAMHSRGVVRPLALVPNARGRVSGDRIARVGWLRARAPNGLHPIHLSPVTPGAARPEGSDCCLSRCLRCIPVCPPSKGEGSARHRPTSIRCLARGFVGGPRSCSRDPLASARPASLARGMPLLSRMRCMPRTIGGPGSRTSRTNDSTRFS